MNLKTLDPHGPMVRILGFHPGGRGSIPRVGESHRYSLFLRWYVYSTERIVLRGSRILDLIRHKTEGRS